MQRILLADKSRRVQENTAAKPAEAEATEKAGEDQATFFRARGDPDDNAQAFLDEAIAEMVSEGSPTR